MKLTPTSLSGVLVLDLEPRADTRGSFARTFDRQAFRAAGLEYIVEQANTARTTAAGTVRGMHLQVNPAPEAKLVRCTRGAILDVAVDVRPGSSTYLRHVTVELSAENGRALYVPPLHAHGYQTLVADTEVTYLVSAPYTPAAERGLRPDDPALGIAWPLPSGSVSDKDASWPLLTDAEVSSRAGLA